MRVAAIRFSLIKPVNLSCIGHSSYVTVMLSCCGVVCCVLCVVCDLISYKCRNVGSRFQLQSVGRPFVDSAVHTCEVTR